MAGQSDDSLRKSKSPEEEVLTFLRNCFSSEQDPLKSLSERFGCGKTKSSPSVIEEED